MNTVIWIVQIILSIKLLTVTLTHGLRQGQPKMEEAIQRLGAWSRPLHTLIAALALLGAAGLLLPGVVGWSSQLTIGSAAAVGC